MTVYGYLRVSTNEQARSGLGLDGQRRAIEAEATRRGWNVEWVVDDGYSARSLHRPGVSRLLAKLGAGDVMVVSRLDRLSRSLVDFAGLMERAQREDWSLVALDLGVDMTTPGGRLVANVMAAVAQWEREVISERTRDALAEARERGVRLGGPRTVSEDVADEARRLRADGLTWRAVADALTAAGHPTAGGATRWTHTSARALALRQPLSP